MELNEIEKKQSVGRAIRRRHHQSGIFRNNKINIISEILKSVSFDEKTKGLIETMPEILITSGENKKRGCLNRELKKPERQPHSMGKNAKESRKNQRKGKNKHGEKRGSKNLSEKKGKRIRRIRGNAGKLHSGCFGFCYGIFSHYRRSIKARLQAKQKNARQSSVWAKLQKCGIHCVLQLRLRR